MNCPKDRVSMEYYRELSTPNAEPERKQLTYYCSRCSTLWVFRDFTPKTTIGGRLVLKMSNLKRAGFSTPVFPMSRIRGGEGEK